MLGKLGRALMLQVAGPRLAAPLDDAAVTAVVRRMASNYRGELMRASDDAALVAKLLLDYDRLRRVEASMCERHTIPAPGFAGGSV